MLDAKVGDLGVARGLLMGLGSYCVVAERWLPIGYANCEWRVCNLILLVCSTQDLFTLTKY